MNVPFIVVLKCMRYDGGWRCSVSRGDESFRVFATTRLAALRAGTRWLLERELVS